VLTSIGDASKIIGVRNHGLRQGRFGRGGSLPPRGFWVLFQEFGFNKFWSKFYILVRFR